MSKKKLKVLLLDKRTVEYKYTQLAYGDTPIGPAIVIHIKRIPNLSDQPIFEFKAEERDYNRWHQWRVLCERDRKREEFEELKRMNEPIISEEVMDHQIEHYLYTQSYHDYINRQNSGSGMDGRNSARRRRNSD